MREIQLKLTIDGVNITSTMTEKEYRDIKETHGLDPVLLMVNRMWEELNMHDDIKPNPILR